MIWKRKRARSRREGNAAGRPPRGRPGRGRSSRHRSLAPERLETRILMAADPVHVGVVFLETDHLEAEGGTGSDAQPDRFILSFTGGAPETELRELVLNTDKDGNGIAIGDAIFDSQPAGRGRGGNHDFQVVRIDALHNDPVSVTPEVVDGGQELVLRFENFRAGDRLEFGIDVDEVLRLSDDLEFFNSRLDTIVSGQEFQDSILEAQFSAPHFEDAAADALFLNEYGTPSESHGLRLPPNEGDDPDSRANRSAGAVGTTQQVPKPVEIEGRVWLDNNLNQAIDAEEAFLADVQLELHRFDEATGDYDDTGHRAVTDADGVYQFPKSLGLMPGTYRVVQRQPEGLFSVAAMPGQVDGAQTGLAESLDVLAGIEIPLGDLAAVNYDFAEAQPAELSGFVYRDDNDNGVRDPGEVGLGGVRIELVPLETIAAATRQITTTAADGSYSFARRPPGEYELIQLDQPDDLDDGLDAAGTVNGRTVGIAENPGDRIDRIELGGGDVGIDYNFGELPLGSLSGFVYHDRSNDGRRDVSEEGIAGVRLDLVDPDGQTVASTTTDAAGRYAFADIPAGEYVIIQHQPQGYLDGIDTPGRIGGRRVGRVGSDGDSLRGIRLKPGEEGVEYNFGELQAVSLSGRVHADRNGDCVWDPDEPRLRDVSVRLLDASGQEVAQTVTDSAGEYHFENLAPATYTIVEQTPEGFFAGSAKPGSAGGVAKGASRIGEIVLVSGQVGIDYNFCEKEPSSLSGSVYVERHAEHPDGDRSPIDDVLIELRDNSGRQVAQTRTDADGNYDFDRLPAGAYRIVQHQPAGYLQGGQRLGSGGGEVLGPDRMAVELGVGSDLVDYDFFERLPAAISGHVWRDVDLDRRFDSGEQPMPGVLIELIDERGEVVAEAHSDTTGRYRFAGLDPGVYGVQQTQPEGLFHGGQVVGSAGGQIAGDDWIVGIAVGSGVTADGYNFPEVPPATISGVVFQDGPPLQLEKAPNPADLREYRDGRLREASERIGGVTLELRTVTGQPLSSDRALPGTYPDGPIRVTTDADGEYVFHGLRPGTYHVYQIQPEGWIDGLDTPGTTGGAAVNPADETDSADQILIEALTADEATDPINDAILRISIPSGGQSRENHFSEIKLDPPEPERPVAPPPTESPHVEQVLAPVPETHPQTMRVMTFATPADIRPLPVYASEWAVSWHLSVINGGYPPGVSLDDVVIQGVAHRRAGEQWAQAKLGHGQWYVGTRDGQLHRNESMELGSGRATALTGDFNGDGFEQPVLYLNGQWFVDLNGNGIWDADDLWIQLGTPLDRPVVGDWDGDGKDDIGIFGRQWERDPRRIRQETGLPNLDNHRRRLVANQPRDAVDPSRPDLQERWLRRGEEGELHADAVDHIFQYGRHIDEPLAGDWNGDGTDQIGVFRDGRWLLDLDGDGRWTSQDRPFDFGRPGDKPIVGDFTGNGIDEIGVVRGDLWIIDTDGDRKLTANDLHIQLRQPSPTSQPITGDFDGDGVDQPGYYDDAS